MGRGEMGKRKSFAEAELSDREILETIRRRQERLTKQAGYRCESVVIGQRDGAELIKFCEDHKLSKAEGVSIVAVVVDLTSVRDAKNRFSPSCFVGSYSLRLIVRNQAGEKKAAVANVIGSEAARALGNYKLAPFLSRFCYNSLGFKANFETSLMEVANLRAVERIRGFKNDHLNKEELVTRVFGEEIKEPEPMEVDEETFTEKYYYEEQARPHFEGQTMVKKEVEEFYNKNILNVERGSSSSMPYKKDEGLEEVLNKAKDSQLLEAIQKIANEPEKEGVPVEQKEAKEEKEEGSTPVSRDFSPVIDNNFTQKSEEAEIWMPDSSPPKTQVVITEVEEEEKDSVNEVVEKIAEAHAGCFEPTQIQLQENFGVPEEVALSRGEEAKKVSYEGPEDLSQFKRDTQFSKISVSTCAPSEDDSKKRLRESTSNTSVGLLPKQVPLPPSDSSEPESSDREDVKKPKGKKRKIIVDDDWLKENASGKTKSLEKKRSEIVDGTSFASVVKGEGRVNEPEKKVFKGKGKDLPSGAKGAPAVNMIAMSDAVTGRMIDTGGSEKEIDELIEKQLRETEERLLNLKRKQEDRKKQGEKEKVRAPSLSRREIMADGKFLSSPIFDTVPGLDGVPISEDEKESPREKVEKINEGIPRPNSAQDHKGVTSANIFADGFAESKPQKLYEKAKDHKREANNEDGWRLSEDDLRRHRGLSVAAATVGSSREVLRDREKSVERVFLSHEESPRGRSEKGKDIRVKQVKKLGVMQNAFGAEKAQERGKSSKVENPSYEKHNQDSKYYMGKMFESESASAGKKRTHKKAEEVKTVFGQRMSDGEGMSPPSSDCEGYKKGDLERAKRRKQQAQDSGRDQEGKDQRQRKPSISDEDFEPEIPFNPVKYARLKVIAEATKKASVSGVSAELLVASWESVFTSEDSTSFTFSAWIWRGEYGQNSQSFLNAEIWVKEQTIKNCKSKTEVDRLSLSFLGLTTLEECDAQEIGIIEELKESHGRSCVTVLLLAGIIPALREGKVQIEDKNAVGTAKGKVHIYNAPITVFNGTSPKLANHIYEGAAILTERFNSLEALPPLIQLRYQNDKARLLTLIKLAQQRNYCSMVPYVIHQTTLKELLWQTLIYMGACCNRAGRIDSSLCLMAEAYIESAITKLTFRWRESGEDVHYLGLHLYSHLYEKLRADERKRLVTRTGDPKILKKLLSDVTEKTYEELETFKNRYEHSSIVKREVEKEAKRILQSQADSAASKAAPAAAPAPYPVGDKGKKGKKGGGKKGKQPKDKSTDESVSVSGKGGGASAQKSLREGEFKGRVPSWMVDEIEKELPSFNAQHVFCRTRLGCRHGQSCKSVKNPQKFGCPYGHRQGDTPCESHEELLKRIEEFKGAKKGKGKGKGGKKE